MPRPHHRNHVPTKSPSIQPSTLDKAQDSSATNRLSPILNRPKQIIEIINDSSSPPTPTEIRNPVRPHLPPLLINHQQAQTTHTMSSDHPRSQYQPPDPRRRFDERRPWPEAHRLSDGPPPPVSRGVFPIKPITVFNRPYAFTFNNEPLYLEVGSPAAAELAHMMYSIPCAPMPPNFGDPRYGYRPGGPAPRYSRYEDERYEQYDGYQRNYESYDGNREMERRVGEQTRRGDEFEQNVRYRHSTGQGGGPVNVGGPEAQSGAEGCQEETEEYERDEEDEAMEAEKSRHRLPTTRTYRDFSHVPSVSGQSEDRERKRQYTSEELHVKRARLNWSEPLHSKFLAAVEELGVEKAVPTSIMKLMKVDGLTRENVASHLQKYRGTIRKEKEEEERRLLLKAAAKSVLEDGAGKMTEEEVIKAVAEREESYKAPAKKRGGKDR